MSGPSRDDQRALDDVLELAHVARPAVRAQERDRVESKLAARRAVQARRLGEQVVGDQSHVVLALAKRRQLDAQHGEAGEQVFTEQTGGDVVLETRLARRDHAAVHRRLVADAEARNAVLLDRAEQAVLQRERQVADLVEEHRAAARQLEHAELARRVVARRRRCRTARPRAAAPESTRS